MKRGFALKVDYGSVLITDGIQLKREFTMKTVNRRVDGFHRLSG